MRWQRFGEAELYWEIYHLYNCVGMLPCPGGGGTLWYNGEGSEGARHLDPISTTGAYNDKDIGWKCTWDTWCGESW